MIPQTRITRPIVPATAITSTNECPVTIRHDTDIFASTQILTRSQQFSTRAKKSIKNNNKRTQIAQTPPWPLHCRPVVTQYISCNMPYLIRPLQRCPLVSDYIVKIRYVFASVKKSEQEVKVIWQKAPHGGPIPRLGVTPGGRKLYHWIPGVGFPISVP